MATPRYFAKRTSPNLGQVMERQPDGSSVPVTSELPYAICVAKVKDHRDEVLHLFKVARIAPRKDAVRRLHCRILAKDLSDAVAQFRTICEAGDPATLQLLTGDWRPICEKGPDGSIQFKNHLN